jgi:uncharacterized phage infection (PIP) family protein YhgE
MSSYEASFYIPRVSTKFNGSGITIAFAFLNIGDVGRVDFNSIPGTPDFQSAFVHITKLYYNPVAAEVKKKVIDEDQAHRVYPDLSNPKVYWILLANKSPVIDTKLNIHQIADNANKMWELVQKQQKMMEDQQKMIEHLKGELGELKGELVQLKSELDELKGELDELSDENDDLKDELRQTRQNLEIDILQIHLEQEQEDFCRKVGYDRHKGVTVAVKEEDKDKKDKKEKDDENNNNSSGFDDGELLAPMLRSKRWK